MSPYETWVRIQVLTKGARQLPDDPVPEPIRPVVGDKGVKCEGLLNMSWGQGGCGMVWGAEWVRSGGRRARSIVGDGQGHGFDNS